MEVQDWVQLTRVNRMIREKQESQKWKAIAKTLLKEQNQGPTDKMDKTSAPKYFGWVKKKGFIIICHLHGLP